MPPAGIRDKGDSPAPERQAGKFLTVNFAAVCNCDHHNHNAMILQAAENPDIADAIPPKT
jgi:hypothetical protein